MTEYELTDTLYSVYATMNDAATMYFALVTAYLVASYVAGSKFTAAQIAIINTLFLLWTAGNINTVYTTLLESLRIQARLAEIGATVFIRESFNYSSWSWSTAAVSGFLVVQVGGILAAFYFMWTVRHARTE